MAAKNYRKLQAKLLKGKDISDGLRFFNEISRHIENHSEKLMSMDKKTFPSFDFVEVRDSSVHGKGIFAVRPIPAYTLITLYPSHLTFVMDAAFSTEVRIKSNIPEMIRNKYTNMENVASACAYLHVLPNGQKIIGIPELTDDKQYLAHMANDSAVLFTDEEEYKKSSLERTNASWWYFWANTMGIVTMRTIEADEEILLPYGYAHWTTCKVCRGIPANKCSQCRQVCYCSKKCQKLDWKTHKHACRTHL